MISGHEILFIDDNEMPDGIDWVMIGVDDEVICAIRQSRVEPRVLEEAWAGYRKLLRRGPRSRLLACVS